MRCRRRARPLHVRANLPITSCLYEPQQLRQQRVIDCSYLQNHIDIFMHTYVVYYDIYFFATHIELSVEIGGLLFDAIQTGTIHVFFNLFLFVRNKGAN